MTTIGFRLISVPNAVLPSSPRSQNPNNDPFQESQPPRQQLPITTSRRCLTMLSFISAVPPLFLPAPATAFDIGISGPKDWLKEQKRKTSKFLLAPIEASRDILQTVYLLLSNDSDYSNKDMEDVQRLLKSAARDCVLKDRNSFVQFQASTGVEVCTFQLIVKNASSLLGNKDPVKLEAESLLKDLVSSFTSLNSLAYETDVQVNSNRLKVLDALNDTMSSLDKFEKAHGLSLFGLRASDSSLPFIRGAVAMDYCRILLFLSTLVDVASDIHPTYSLTDFHLTCGLCLWDGWVAEVNKKQKPALYITSGSKVFHHQGESVMPKSKVSASGSPICDSVVLENPRDGSR